MRSETVSTKFAPAERSSVEVVEQQKRYFSEWPLLTKLINSVPEIIMILNKNRQIVFSNQSLLAALGVQDDKAVCGRRPGEVLDCIHATESECGCGTTEFCSTCGGVKAILKSQKGEADVKECRIIQKSTGDALDLRVYATPLEIHNERFTVFTVSDISHEKRRQNLERIFFHDILNTAGTLQGYTELLVDADADELQELSESVHRISEKLMEEIQAQRQLIAAENNELVVNTVEIHSLEFLDDVIEMYKSHRVARDRHLLLDTNVADIEFESDETLLTRVIGNMVKNALEACVHGETVTVGCKAHEGTIEFWVHNPAFMPREVQLQLFQRSFSTKGAGRGLGTYSMKLLSERYLKGHVSFTTSKNEGTTFRAIYPINSGKAKTGSEVSIC